MKKSVKHNQEMAYILQKEWSRGDISKLRKSNETAEMKSE